MTKYVYGEHFTQRDHDKVVKANIYMLPQFNVETKFYNSETGTESIATGIQVFLKNNYTNTTRRGVSDDYGQVTFYDVPAGDYELRGVDSTKIYGDAVKRIFLNKNSSTSETLTLYTPFVPEVNFRLIDSESNEPIPNLITDIVRIEGDYSNTTVSDSEGISNFKKVPTGTYNIRIQGTSYYDETYSTQEINPQHYEFDIIVQSHLVKKFKVLVYNSMEEEIANAPIPNATVKIHHNESGQEFTGTTGEDGYYTFTNIINGKYTVSLSHQDYRADDKTITVKTQEEGEEELLPMKPKYGNARLIIEDSETQEPIPEVTVKMVSADEGIPTLTRESGEDGIVNLNNIYLGKYNVLCTNKYYEDTFSVVELDHDSTTTISMDKVELDNIKFKVINRWGNKELLDHKEVQFFKKEHPREEDQPDYTVEVEDGYTNTFIIPAGKYTVKFHDNDTMYDWVSDDYIPSFVDKFLYNVDLNKTTQEQTVELEGNLLPELKMLAFNIGGGRVKNYKFHIEGESPFTLTDILTSSDNGELSTKYGVVYGSKVRVYCYDTGTHNNDIIFDEEFIIDTWDEDYVKEIHIGARTIPTYAIKVLEYGSDDQPTTVIRSGSQVMVKTSDGLSILSTVDGTNGLVKFNNILKEEDNIEVSLNSDVYDGFWSDSYTGSVIKLTTHFDNADTPDAYRTLIASRYYYDMSILVRNKNNVSDMVWGVRAVVTKSESFSAPNFDQTTGNSGRTTFEGIYAGKYTYTLTKEGWKTVIGEFDLTKNDADQTKIIDMELDIDVRFDVKDNFGLPINSGTIKAVGGGKTYTGTITNGQSSIKVNSYGDYRFEITSTDKDNAGNLVHYDETIYETIQENTIYTTIISRLTRKSVMVYMKAKYDHGWSTDYAYGFNVLVQETSQNYTASGATCTFPVPAGMHVTLKASYANISALATVNYNVGTTAQNIEVYMQR